MIITRDLLRGMLFAAIGIAAILTGRGYGVGMPSAMGAGFFPVLTGVLLAGFGISDVVRALAFHKGIPLHGVRLWPVLCLSCGVVGFGLLIEDAGLLVAVAVLTGFAFLARKRFNPLEALAIYAVLILLSGSLYVFGLGSPISYLLAD